MTNVFVVIVTYGNRFNLLSKVLEQIMKLSYPIQKIIIVDNNSNSNYKKELLKIERQNFLVKIVTLNENKGSAYGYKCGIKESLKYSSCEFIWLLDDDNFPEKESLEILINQWDKFTIFNKEKMVALCSLRINRNELVEVAASGKLPKNLNENNSFLGFHYKYIYKNVLKKFGFSSKRVNIFKNFDIVQVRMLPYGGLFFHKKIIEKIGYPKEEFYLYSDDHEFTLRISKTGGQLWLVSNSKIKDLDQSWNCNEIKKSKLPIFLTSNSINRIYYYVRNRVFLEKNYLIDSMFSYKINVFIYLCYLLLLAVLCNKKVNLKWIIRSLRDGWRGKLGKEKNFESYFD